MPSTIVTPALNETTAAMQFDGAVTVNSQYSISGAAEVGNGCVVTSPAYITLKVWDYPLDQATQLSTAAGQQTSQTLGLYSVWMRNGLTVSTVYAYQAVAGNTVSTTVAFAGIYYGSTSSTAALVSSTAALSVTNLSTAVGFKSFPLTASYTTTAAGQYYIGFLLQATTMPVFASLTTNMTPTIAAGPVAAAAQYPFSTNGTSLSTLPTTVTTTSNSLTNAVCSWFALA